MEINKTGKKEQFLQNFFGVNIFTEPDDTWEYVGWFKGKNEHYDFVSEKLRNRFFSNCKAIVIEGEATNFIFGPIPYDDFIPYQIALDIERNLLDNGDMTLSQCVRKYERALSSSSFDIKAGEYHIRINFGFDKEEISLTLWTHLVKDELINRTRKRYPNKIIEDPNRAHLMSKEQFLKNFFGIDIANVPNEKWKYLGSNEAEQPDQMFYFPDLEDEFFSSCSMSVLSSGCTLFIWGPSPASDLASLKVAARIHQNLLGEEDFSLTDSIRTYSDYIMGDKDTIEIRHEGYFAKINLDRFKGTFTLTLLAQIDKREIVCQLLKGNAANGKEVKEKNLSSAPPVSVKKVDIPEPITQEPLPNWSDFFGIDLLKSPNQEWYELSGETNPSGEKIRNFKIYEGLGDYFTELEAKVIGKTATNFFLRAPYSSKNAFDIYYTIERNIVHPGITEKDAENNFKGQFDSIYDSIHWDIEKCSIIMDRDFDTEEIKLGVWTHLYNAEFLDIEPENEAKAIPEHCWNDVYGFDLTKSPNSKWIETAGQVNPSGDRIRNFRCNELRGTYFTELEAKVIGKKATNFFFTAPYSIENAVDIYYNVEKLFAHPSITKKEASNNFRGQFDSIYDSIHWDFEKCSIIMDRDYDTEDIKLKIWTHLYNAEYLDAEANYDEGNNSPVENLDNNVKKIAIQLPGGVATLTFLKRVLVNRMNNTDENYGLTVSGDIINVYNLETQEHIYQFENRQIGRLIGNKLVAAMFQNINLDDIENPKVDLYIAFPGGQ